MEEHAEEVVLQFDHPRVASNLNLDQPWLEGGLYEVKGLTKDRLVLVRAESDKGPDEIRVLNVSSSEAEWRLFASGQIDVMTSATSWQVEALESDGREKLLPCETRTTVSLFFRLTGVLGDPRLRRAIALSLDRVAIAEELGAEIPHGVPARADLQTAAILVHEVFGTKREVPTLELIFHDRYSELRHLGLVLQKQLRTVGLDVRLRPVSIDELEGRVSTGEFDLVVTSGGYEEKYLPFAFATNGGANFSKYSSQRFDQALRRGDVVEAQRILAEDVPATPLFRVKGYAVVRKGICGARPRVPWDWSWMADLSPCDGQETGHPERME